MEDSGAERRIKRTALTREARRKLDQLIAARLLKAGFDPYKPSAIGRADDGGGGEYDPDLRARWVFPTIGLSRAARMAGQLTAAAQGKNLSSLRLVTLRVSKTRPKPNELNSSLDSLSRKINIHVPYMKKRKWIDPILSVPQIRLDHDGKLDLHLHALWHIAPECLDRISKYLKTRYRGGVWIDDVPIRSLRKTAFYIASGMLDYPAVPEWPDDILKAIWELERRRMIRPAGWFAAHLKGSDDTPPSKAMAGTARKNTPKRRQEAAEAARRAKDGLGPSKRKNPSRNAAGGVHGSKSGTRGALGGEKQRNRKGAKGDPNLSTVRPAAPESEFYNPSATPSIDEFWTVFRLLESKDTEEPHESFEEFCTRLSLNPLHVQVAVSRVEAYIEASLFYPSGYWSPTREGLAFLDKGRPHLHGLDMLVVELGVDARWARQPGRRAFEARMGHGRTSSSGIPQPPEPEDE